MVRWFAGNSPAGSHPIELYSPKWPSKPLLRFVGFIRDRVDRPFFQRYEVQVVWVILIGLLANFSIEILLSLMFRNYPVFDSLGPYFVAVLVALFVFSGIRSINRRLNRAFPWEANPVKRFVVQAGADLSFTLATVAVLKVLLPLVVRWSGFTNLLEATVTLVVVGIFTLVIVMGDLSSYLLNNWRTSLAEVEKFKKESVESQLQMLKTQVNPHFLFNSLNTLNSLIHQDSETATQFVRQLSRVYRYVLESRNQEVISLREELDVNDAYIYLLQIRFSAAIRFELNIREEDQDRLVAPMTLQMLIENAIKHNVVSQKRPLVISISTNPEGLLEVANNLQVKEEAEASTEVGLRNIRSRYAFLTEKGIQVEQSEEQFIVKIPLVDSHERLDH